jgi:hypothetical protein
MSRRPFIGANAPPFGVARGVRAGPKKTLCCAPSDEAAPGVDDAADAATPLDGELRETPEAGIRTQNLTPDDLREADRHVLDRITDKGGVELRAIAENVFTSLDDVSRVSNERAEEIMQKELQVTLDQIDERRKELIASATVERANIRTEAERIKELAASLSNGSASRGQPGSFGSQDLRK